MRIVLAIALVPCSLGGALALVGPGGAVALLLSMAAVALGVYVASYVATRPPKPEPSLGDAASLRGRLLRSAWSSLVPRPPRRAARAPVSPTL